MSGRFRYRAATPEGHVVEGVVHAPSRGGALEEIRRQRLVPVDVEAEGGGGLAAQGATGRRLRRADAQAMAMRTLATLLGAGLSLDRALGFAAEHAGHPVIASALSDARTAVQGGGTLAAAFAAREDAWPPVASAMTMAGEEGGALDESLARLADHMEQGAALRGQLRTALLYPALMAVASLTGVIVLLVVVVPRFVAMLGDAGAALPWSTRVLVGASRAIVGAWWLWVPLVALGVVALRGWLARPANRARWHAARLGWPVTGALERALATALFARTLGTLLRSGVPLLAALRVARGGVRNLAIQRAVDRAMTDVAQGARLAPSLEGVLPPLAAQLFALGEESGQLDAMALRVADAHDGEVRRALQALVGLVEPALILLFGAIVGFIALAMLQAIYGATAAVR